jgi:hypothetical protein
VPRKVGLSRAASLRPTGLYAWSIGCDPGHRGKLLCAYIKLRGFGTGVRAAGRAKSASDMVVGTSGPVYMTVNEKDRGRWCKKRENVSLAALSPAQS